MCGVRDAWVAWKTHMVALETVDLWWLTVQLYWWQKVAQCLDRSPPTTQCLDLGPTTSNLDSYSPEE